MKIVSVRADLHVFDGVVNHAEPIRLALEFEGCPPLRLCLSGDGEGFILDRLPLEGPLEMDEFGRIETFEIGGRLGLVGREVERLLSIRLPGGKLAGLALDGGDRAPFCIWNDGDTFHWGDEAALNRHDWLPEARGSIGEALVV